jgi:hypothetical protein
VSPLEKNRQRASELLARLSQPRGLDLHVIAQHQLLGIRMQVHLLVHPVGHRVAAQVMLQQRQGHDQWHQPLPVVLDEAQKLLLIFAREVILAVTP